MTLLLLPPRTLSRLLPRTYTSIPRHTERQQLSLYPHTTTTTTTTTHSSLPLRPFQTPPKAKMSTYIAKTSSSPSLVPESVLKFYQKFYATSDDPSASAHNAYVDAFTPDATLMMGTRKATGSEELMALRKGLWTGPVKTRLHTVEKIYGWDEEGSEVMLFGNVKYGLVNGKEVVVEWAGRAELVFDEEGGVRMGFYQVYLDSAPVANAMKD